MINVIPTSIPEVKIIEPKLFGDSRGFFYELFQEKNFSEHIPLSKPFVQDNLSRSQKGVLRGLHYQYKEPQGKLVTVLRGAVFDVVVDVRKGSPSYGKWVGVELNEENRRQLWVPEGFAHGFYVLSDTADFYYKCNEYYQPQYEKSLLWNDATVNIQWPFDGTPTLSSKDQQGTLLHDILPSELPTYGDK